MKKFYALLIGFILLVSLSSVALARTQYGNFALNRIVIIEDNPIVSSVAVDNDLGTEFDGKLIVSIPELGLWASKKVSLRDGKYDTNNVFLDITEDVPAGDYYVRVVVANEDFTRTRHRLITIE